MEILTSSENEASSVRHIWVVWAFPLELGLSESPQENWGSRMSLDTMLCIPFNSSLPFYPLLPKCMAPCKKLWSRVHRRYVSSQPWILSHGLVGWLSLPLMSSIWNMGPQHCTEPAGRKLRTACPRRDLALPDSWAMTPRKLKTSPHFRWLCIPDLPHTRTRKENSTVKNWQMHNPLRPSNLQNCNQRRFIAVFC